MNGRERVPGGPAIWAGLVVIATTILVGVVYVLSQLLGAGTFIVAEMVGLPAILQTPAAIIAVEMLGFGSASLAVVAVGRRLDVPIVRVGVPDAVDLALIAVGTIGALAVLITVGMISQLLGVQPTSHSITAIGEAMPVVFLILAVLSIPVIGAMEELFFRGVVHDVLLTAIPRRATVVVAAALFALPHLFSYLPGQDGGTLAGMAVAMGSLFLIGIVLGGLYELSENVVVPAVVHGAYNAFQFLVAYVGAVMGVGQFA